MNVLSDRAIRAIPNHEDMEIETQNFSEVDIPKVSRKYSILRKRNKKKWVQSYDADADRLHPRRT